MKSEANQLSIMDKNEIFMSFSELYDYFSTDNKMCLLSMQFINSFELRKKYYLELLSKQKDLTFNINTSALARCLPFGLYESNIFECILQSHIDAKSINKDFLDYCASIWFSGLIFNIVNNDKSVSLDQCIFDTLEFVNACDTIVFMHRDELLETMIQCEKHFKSDLLKSVNNSMEILTLCIQLIYEYTTDKSGALDYIEKNIPENIKITSKLYNALYVALNLSGKC